MAGKTGTDVAWGMSAMTVDEHAAVVGMMLEAVRRILIEDLPPLMGDYRGYVVDALFAAGLEHLNGTEYIVDMDAVAKETGFSRYDDGVPTPI